jgi:hypothetical protein
LLHDIRNLAPIIATGAEEEGGVGGGGFGGSMEGNDVVYEEIVLSQLQHAHDALNTIHVHKTTFEQRNPNNHNDTSSSSSSVERIVKTVTHDQQEQWHLQTMHHANNNTNTTTKSFVTQAAWNHLLLAIIIYVTEWGSELIFWIHLYCPYIKTKHIFATTRNGIIFEFSCAFKQKGLVVQNILLFPRKTGTI